MLDIVQGRVVD